MTMHGMARGGSIRSFAKDPSVRSHKVGRETARRVLAYGRPFVPDIVAYLLLAVVGGLMAIAIPLLLQRIIDDGVTPGDRRLVVTLAVVVAGLAVGAVVTLAGYVLVVPVATRVVTVLARTPVRPLLTAGPGAAR